MALKKDPNTIIDCMIIYPDMESGYVNLNSFDLHESRIKEYVGMYKIGVRLPFVK